MTEPWGMDASAFVLLRGGFVRAGDVRVGDALHTFSNEEETIVGIIRTPMLGRPLVRLPHGVLVAPAQPVYAHASRLHCTLDTRRADAVGELVEGAADGGAAAVVVAFVLAPPTACMAKDALPLAVVYPTPAPPTSEGSWIVLQMGDRAQACASAVLAPSPWMHAARVRAALPQSTSALVLDSMAADGS